MLWNKYLSKFLDIQIEYQLIGHLELLAPLLGHFLGFDFPCSARIVIGVVEVSSEKDSFLVGGGQARVLVALVPPSDGGQVGAGADRRSHLLLQLVDRLQAASVSSLSRRSRALFFFSAFRLFLAVLANIEEFILK